MIVVAVAAFRSGGLHCFGHGSDCEGLPWGELMDSEKKLFDHQGQLFRRVFQRSTRRWTSIENSTGFHHTIIYSLDWMPILFLFHTNVLTSDLFQYNIEFGSLGDLNNS